MIAAVLAAGMATGQAAAAPGGAVAPTAGGPVVTGHARARSLPRLQPRTIQATSGNGVKKPTLPFYTGHFTTAGKTYSYTSLGTDPRTSSATTHIPVTLVPIRVFVLNSWTRPAGDTGLTAGSALFRNSPVFGNTQYGDATLRSGYWRYVQAHKGKWHVRFDKPTIRPELELHVPANEANTSLDGSGHLEILVNDTWWTNELFKIAATVPANSLAALLTWNVIGCANVNQQSTCGLAGVHGDTSNKAGTHVFGWASWDETTVFVSSESSTGWLSNMLAASLNNPFADDVVPNWSTPTVPCTNQFAVGAPVKGNFLSVNGLEYQDVADLSWFARQQPSTGLQGRYSYFGTLTKLPASC